MLSLYFQDVLGHSALVAGLMFLPLTALIAGTNVVAGRLTSREGPRRPLIAGEVVLIAGLLGMLAFGTDTPTAVILVLLIPMGIGGGLAIPPLTAALLEALPAERAGLASGVFNAARQFGGGLGVAVFGGLVAGGFVSGMHVALVLGAIGVAATLALTLAHVPAGAGARGRAGRRRALTSLFGAAAGLFRAAGCDRRQQSATKEKTMEQSTAPTAVVAQPKTIVIERRWAIVGGAVIAALIIGLGVALAFSAGDDHGPGGPPGFQLSAEGAQGYGPGFAPPGTQQTASGRAGAAGAGRRLSARRRQLSLSARGSSSPTRKPGAGPSAELAGRQRFRRELEPVATAVDTAREPCWA